MIFATEVYRARRKEERRSKSVLAAAREAFFLTGEYFVAKF
jgi:hypothetical protein